MMQWLLFFYIYCFFGWVWESCYVSVRKREWVNRGFLHGPLLPIYGFGAISVLLITMPVKENVGLIFMFGMIGATILEYFTGVLMEQLFHVRYWDYSEQFLNLKGHICLRSSLAWGVFSIGMVRFVHVPIQRMIEILTYQRMKYIVGLLTVGFLVDFTQSFHEAMDLKALLKNLTETKAEIGRIRKRADVILAILDAERKEMLQKASDSKEALEVRINNSIEWMKSHKARNHSSVALDTMERFEKLRVELEELKESLKKQTGKLHNRREKSYLRSMRLLRRNPNTVSKRYGEALQEVQKFEKEKK